MNQLSEDIKDYLLRSNEYVSMSVLSAINGCNPRQVRKAIEEIILETDLVIISNDLGYKIARSEEEILEANRLRISRIKTSFKLLSKNGFKNMNFLFDELKEVINERDVVPEGQYTIFGETRSYIKNEEL